MKYLVLAAAAAVAISLAGATIAQATQSQRTIADVYGECQIVIDNQIRHKHETGGYCIGATFSFLSYEKSIGVPDIDQVVTNLVSKLALLPWRKEDCVSV